jgi:hypothetical protein
VCTGASRLFLSILNLAVSSFKIHFVFPRTHIFRMVSSVLFSLSKLYSHFEFEVLKAVDYEEHCLL